MDRLTLLVFSFYREEPKVQVLLDPLKYCKISRGWDSIEIDCLNSQHLQLVLEISIYIGPPFALLGMAKHIVFKESGLIHHRYSIQLRSNSDLSK